MNAQVTRGSALEHCALLRVAKMGEADRLTVASGIPGIELMSSAGAAVAREIVRSVAFDSASPLLVKLKQPGILSYTRR